MLNFKDWLKISGDEKTSTLRHEKGHIMTIAHDALPKIQMEQLMRLKMAEGGHVESGKKRFDNEKGVHPDPGEGDRGGMSMAGIFERHAKDKGVGKDSHERSIKEHKRVLNEQKEMNKKDRKYLAEGTPEAPLSSESGSDSSSQPKADPNSVNHNQPITINVGAPSAAAPAEAAPSPYQNPQTAQVMNTEPSQVPSQPGPGQSSVISDPRAAAASSVGLQQQAIQGQQNIDVQKAQQQAQYEDAYLKQRAAIAQQDQDHYDELKQHTDDFNQHIQQNPINPTAYTDNMSGGKKMATGLGLLLGGMSGKGQSNVAMDFLNKQIDRNIHAQQQNINNQNTVYGAYRNLYGDSNIATSLAKVSANDLLVHQAQLMAAKLGTQQAAVNANALSAQKGIENTKELGLAAQRLGALRKGVVAPKDSGIDQQENNENPSPEKNPEESNAGQSGGLMNSANASMIPVKSNDIQNNLPTYKILAPGALDRSVGLKGVGLVNHEKLQGQLTSAAQAEKVLNGPRGDGVGGINDLMNQMYEDIGRGSATGSLEHNIKSNIGHIPYIGQGAEAAMNMLGQGEGYKDYNSKSQALKTDLGSALNGLISVNDLDRIVDANSPQLGDTPEDIKEKTQMIVNTIKKALKTDELEKWKLVNKQGK